MNNTSKSQEQEKKFPVREGTEDNSIRSDKKIPGRDVLPEPEIKDQKKNQPEFTEEQPNRKSPNSAAVTNK